MTVKDNTSGLKYVVDVDLCVWKCNYGEYSGAINKETEFGFLGICDEEVPDDVRSAISTVGGWDDNTHIEIPGDQFTPEAIEAWYREVTGLTAADGWTFFINWFDDSKAYTGNEVAIGLRNDNVNDEGRTIVVACGPVLNIAQP